MDLDCTTGRILALALIAWAFVSVPFGLIVGACIHHAQHDMRGNGMSAASEWQ